MWMERKFLKHIVKKKWDRSWGKMRFSFWGQQVIQQLNGILGIIWFCFMILGKWTQGLGRLSDLSNVTEAPKVVFISDNSQYVTQWKGVLCSKFIYKALADLCHTMKQILQNMFLSLWSMTIIKIGMLPLKFYKFWKTKQFYFKPYGDM